MTLGRRRGRSCLARISVAGSRPFPVAPKFLAGLVIPLCLGTPAYAETRSASEGNVDIRPQVPVTAEVPRRPLGNNSPVLASDPTDPNFLALASRVDGPDYSCALHVSTDRGRSWAPVPEFPLLPEQAEKCYAPSVAFDATGKMFYAFSGLAGTSNSPVGYFLTSSSNKGNTFAIPRKVLGPHSYMVQMKIDESRGEKGRIYLVWVSADDPAPSGFSPIDNPILFRFSDDGGRHFSTPTRASDGHRQRAVRPAIAIGRDGAVHVLYYDLKEDARDYLGLEGPVWDGTWALVATTSKDGGSRFARGVVVNDSIVPPERIMLIFNASSPPIGADRNGSVYASWWDARNGDWDVFLSASKDDASTWSTPIRINDDRLRNGRHQYLPSLGVGTSGRVDVVFYDRRRDQKNLRNDLYYAYSLNGGRRFSANRRVNDISFDSRIGFIYSPTIVPSSQGLFEFGSHPALISNESGAVISWTDTSSGNLEYYRHQNIFSTSVALSIDDRRSPVVVWAILVGASASFAAGTALILFQAARPDGEP